MRISCHARNDFPALQIGNPAMVSSGSAEDSPGMRWKKTREATHSVLLDVSYHTIPSILARFK